MHLLLVVLQAALQSLSLSLSFPISGFVYRCLYHLLSLFLSLSLSLYVCVCVCVSLSPFPPFHFFFLNVYVISCCCSWFPQWLLMTGHTLLKPVSWTTGKRLWPSFSPIPYLRNSLSCVVRTFTWNGHYWVSLGSIWRQYYNAGKSTMHSNLLFIYDPPITDGRWKFLAMASCTRQCREGFVRGCLALSLTLWLCASDTLAHRLETEKDGELSLYASLCYICSGNLVKMVENWVRNTDNNNTPLALQVCGVDFEG